MPTTFLDQWNQAQKIAIAQGKTGEAVNIAAARLILRDPIDECNGLVSLAANTSTTPAKATVSHPFLLDHPSDMYTCFNPPPFSYTMPPLILVAG